MIRFTGLLVAALFVATPVSAGTKYVMPDGSIREFTPEELEELDRFRNAVNTAATEYPTLEAAAEAVRGTWEEGIASGRSDKTSVRALVSRIAMLQEVCLKHAPIYYGRYTLEDFTRLRLGHLRVEVQCLLRRRGTVVASSLTAAGRTEIWQWQGDDGATITATFENERLTSISQTGLR